MIACGAVVVGPGEVAGKGAMVGLRPWVAGGAGLEAFESVSLEVVVVAQVSART